jgi:hypothetical protein
LPFTDATGVGGPVTDLFQANGVVPVPVVITAGHADGSPGAGVKTVPKITLISHLDALLSAGRLKIHADLPEAETLIQELQDYQIQYTAAGNLTANARQGTHDDIVLAAALAIWRLSGGRMGGWGSFEYARQRSLSVLPREPERLVIGLDLGKRRDSSALVVARRIYLYEHEFADITADPLQPMGGDR